MIISLNICNFLVMFRLYDTDGNGVLDTNVRSIFHTSSFIFPLKRQI